MSVLTARGLLSTNHSSRFNSLCLLYSKLKSKYGDTAIYFTNLTLQILNNCMQSNYIVPQLLKSLNISIRKSRNKKYVESLRKQIIFKTFECLFYFIGDKISMEHICKRDNIELILETISTTFKLSNYSLNKRTHQKQVHNIMYQQMLLTSFVRRILISTNVSTESRLLFFTTKFYLYMSSNHQIIIYFLEQIYNLSKSIPSVKNILEKNFVCILNFLCELFESAKASIQCYNCFKKFFQHITFVCEFICEYNEKGNIFDHHKDKFILILLKLFSCIIVSGDEYENIIEFIMNHKISNGNDYFIDWLFKRIVEKKSMSINKPFWKFIANLCRESQQWPDRFYKLYYFDNHYLDPHWTVPMAGLIGFSKVLMNDQIDSETIQDLCCILEIGLNTSVRNNVRWVYTVSFCHNGFLSDQDIVIPLLKLYHENKRQNDLQLLLAIMSVFFPDSLNSNRCVCVQLKQLIEIGGIKMCFEMIKKSIDILKNSNQHILTDAVNLLMNGICSVKLILKSCLNSCVIQSENDILGSFTSTKEQFHQHADSMYLPYPSRNKVIFDSSTSYNDELSINHHTMKCYPQYFVWQIKRYNTRNNSVDLLQEAVDLMNSLKIDDEEFDEHFKETSDTIFKFIHNYDIDEKQMETDLTELKQHIAVIEHKYYSFDVINSEIMHESNQYIVYITQEIIYCVSKIDAMIEALRDDTAVIHLFDINGSVINTILTAMNFDVALALLLSFKFTDSINNIFRNLTLFICIVNMERQNEKMLEFIIQCIILIIKLIYSVSFYDIYGQINNAYYPHYWLAFDNFLMIYSKGNENKHLWEYICIHFYIFVKKFKFRYIQCIQRRWNRCEIFPPIQYYKGFHSLLYDLVNEFILLTNDELLKKSKQLAFKNEKCCNFKCFKKRKQLLRFARCKGCLTTHYCSYKCQKYHWKHGHGIQCKTIQLIRDETYYDRFSCVP